MAASGTSKKVTLNNLLSSSPTATGAFTVSGLVTAGSAAITGNLTLTGGTANGVPYLNASKVVTTGTNLSFANTPGFFDSTLNINSLLGSGLYRGGITVSEDNTSFTLFGGSGYKLIQASGFSTPNELIFYVSNAEAARFNSTANLVLKGGTAGANGVGVTFPATQVASSDANCLDDYEEGTWTIGLTFGGASVGLTTALNTGRYTKIGRQVTVCGRLELSNKGSSTGAAVITGLPFAIGSGNDSAQGVSFRFNGVSYTGSFQGYGGIGSTLINLEQISEAGSPTALTDSNFNNGTSIQISFTYTV